MTGTSEAKKALRERVLEGRRRLDATDLAVAARRLRDVLLKTPEVVEAERIAAYVSVGREPGTGPLLDALVAREITVLLPVLLPDEGLDWADYSGPGGLTAAARGLLEPVGPRLGPGALKGVDAILVPGLAVDRRGVRLGRGAGCYDRALASVAGTFTCVLLHDGEVLDLPIPRAPHDVPIAAAATPSGLIRFR